MSNKRKLVVYTGSEGFNMIDDAISRASWIMRITMLNDHAQIDKKKADKLKVMISSSDKEVREIAKELIRIKEQNNGINI